jgi:hypothetical protein
MELLTAIAEHTATSGGRQRFGGADVPAEQRLADLESSLAQVKLDPAANAPLLAPLLDIPLPQERTSTLAPEELRRRQLAALTAWSIASARIQPVVLALEDLHWADPTSLELLRGIAERGALAPLFVVRRNHASGRAYYPTHPCERLCRTGNQGRGGTGAASDRKLKHSERHLKTHCSCFQFSGGSLSRVRWRSMAT